MGNVENIEGCEECVSSEVKVDIRAKFNLKISILHIFLKVDEFQLYAFISVDTENLQQNDFHIMDHSCSLV